MIRILMMIPKRKKRRKRKMRNWKTTSMIRILIRIFKNSDIKIL